jgi:hypothetical protein
MFTSTPLPTEAASSSVLLDPSSLDLFDDANATNSSLGGLQCPTFDEYDDVLISRLSFWVEGVVQSCVALAGIIGNVISATILSR